MDWQPYLQDDESVRWEGRPAPRCFTFRHWRRSLLGILLFLLALYWQVLGVQLRAVYGIVALGWIPLPFVLLGLYLGFGQLVRARLEWEKVFYAVTDRRILVHRGIRRSRLDALPLAELVYFQLQPHGENLGTLRVWGAEENGRAFALPCIEFPGRVAELLEKAILSRDQP